MVEQTLKTHLLRLGVHVPVSCVARTCAATWSLFEQTTIHRTWWSIAGSGTRVFQITNEYRRVLFPLSSSSIACVWFHYCYFIIVRLFVFLFFASLILTTIRDGLRESGALSLRCLWIVTTQRQAERLSNENTSGFSAAGSPDVIVARNETASRKRLQVPCPVADEVLIEFQRRGPLVLTLHPLLRQLTSVLF